MSLDCPFLIASSVFSNVYLFVFVLCLVYRGLPMSLECPFLFASSVFSHVYLFVFVLCLAYRGLPMSLDCPFLFASSVFSHVYLFVFVLCLTCVPLEKTEEQTRMDNQETLATLGTQDTGRRQTNKR
jgi:hypothetical protein